MEAFISGNSVRARRSAWRPAGCYTSAPVLSRRCREGLRLLKISDEPMARFSRSLGPTRDVEMLCQRLTEEHHPSPGCRHLQGFFEKRHQMLRQRLVQKLRSQAARRLPEQLQQVIRKEKLEDTDEDTFVRSALHKAYKRLRRLWKERPKKPDNAYLHPLRRAIRRLRYVAELSAPINGKKRLKRLPKRAIRWQRVLGDYQDALIAQKLLRPVRRREARILLKEFRVMEKDTAKKFWKKWRRRGWPKLKRQTRKTLKAID